MCVRMIVCGYVHMSAGDHRDQNEFSADFELPNVDVGKQTWVLCKSSNNGNH